MNIDSVSAALVILVVILQIWRTGGRQDRGGRYRRTFFEDEDPVISYEDDFYAADYPDYDNGALSIILSTLTDQMVDELRSDRAEERVDRLTEAQAMAIKDKLKGLYAHLKDHPALMERRLYVGSKKPDFPKKHTARIRKRDFSLDIAQPVCPASTEWRLLQYAKDINDTEVEVYQPHVHGASTVQGQQWFHTVECRNGYQTDQRDCTDCCMGINHARFSSSCRQRKTYVMAYVRRLGRTDVQFDWNWIQVDTSCNCAITPKFTSRRGFL